MSLVMRNREIGGEIGKMEESENYKEVICKRRTH